MYRMKKPKHHEHRRSAVDITTPVKLYVHNGTKTNFAFPCWYQELHRPVPAHIHDRKMHDHHGWPNPTHPDHICQLWIPELGHCVHGFRECHPHCRHYIDYSKVVPIHLLSEYEGYSPDVDVAWVEKPDGVTATAQIDQVEDWVVRLHIDAHDAEALEEPQVYKLSLFLNAGTRRDLVVLAELTVLPAAYEPED